METYQHPLKREDFGHSNHTIGDIPTTYYSIGHISDVLKEWDNTFRLYRVNDKETFSFDISKIDSKVRAKALRDVCPWSSAVCAPCFDPKRSVTEIHSSRIFSEAGWYASFAKISNDAVTELWNLMKLPFTADITQLEHAFISNLKEPLVTAGIHANPMTSSMAIQFIGRKTWLFFPPETYLNSMGASPAAPILLPRRSPKDSYTLYVYTSEPGDILFFPEAWAHIVLTYDGPNVMVNYRKWYPMNFLRQPLTWIASAINQYRSPLIHEAGQVAGNELQQVSVPEKTINYEAYKQLDKLCEGGVQTAFDKDMMKVFEDEVAKYRHSK